ncbi:uncharacterized protein LOC129958339 isoform X1 [Argiope bruennichi]|uniref:Uncharacterized protein n=1 Tax=Argiope bruennichi TaxID=94029 RepID=A0A8T0F4E6_ARGBR|nr:uncharacterized protein LOC129958339 isoform X1 [Argiope bruennichi]KAF8784280.1 hypothetical protein HNY73_009981 [Argiope bruennichi]
MFYFSVMAFGGCEGEEMEEKLRHKNSSLTDKTLNDISSQDKQDCVNLEKSLDEFINNGDSLSSSASMSDSDLTSTDSDDSLALSESESITDVTPLNSPYCDSPLCQSRLSEYKLEDRSVNPTRNLDSGKKSDGCDPPEVNILMQAIEKLEIEAKKGEQPNPRGSSSRRRTVSCGGEDVKRIDQENQRLFKRVIAQQNRMRAMYSCPNQSCWKNMKHPDLVKSDGDISVLKKGVQSPKNVKDPTRHSQRQQKCLSHPSYLFSCGPVSSKRVPNEDSGEKEDKILENSVASSTSAI